MSPRLWHLAVIAVAFAVIGAGSCAEVLDHGPENSDPYVIGFLVSGVLAGGPLVLLGFRLPRARREAWPDIRQVLLLGAASWVAAYGSLAAISMGASYPDARPPSRSPPCCSSGWR